MACFDSGYSRCQAIEDGLLIDVTPMANDLGILFPVAVSKAIYNHYGIRRDVLHDNIGWVIQCAFMHPRWLSGEEVGEFVKSVLVDNPDWGAIIHIRVIVERRDDGPGVEALILEREESTEFRCARASLYDM